MTFVVIGALRVKKASEYVRKFHNHILQTNPWHCTKAPKPLAKTKIENKNNHKKLDSLSINEKVKQTILVRIFAVHNGWLPW